MTDLNKQMTELENTNIKLSDDNVKLRDRIEKFEAENRDLQESLNSALEDIGWFKKYLVFMKEEAWFEEFKKD